MDPKCKLILDTMDYCGFSPDVFFETGTGEANTLRAIHDTRTFSWHFSCEVDPHQYLKSLQVMMWADLTTVVHGPSVEVMPRLLPLLRDRSIVFWLDAHYNEGHELYDTGCPVMDEVGNIEGFHPENNLILIDDAQLFGVDPAYPTPEKLTYWAEYNGYGIERIQDIYCISKDE